VSLQLLLINISVRMALKWLQKELDELESNMPEGCSAGPAGGGEDLFRWDATFLAPEGSPYAGGIFFVSVAFPLDYPFQPPVVKFETPVFHPNVMARADLGGKKNAKGKVMLDILLDSWSPETRMRFVLSAVADLLRKYPDPDCDGCVNVEASQMCRDDREKFVARCAADTEKYAS
jgi:ubiquitin-conjugating enzyme E2 D/E